ncbi:MAG TPA: hypothetical protein VMF89_03835, partial [Polyangiales bacterium]|nr:hypothetical protein [Polyangiales bacterium]
MHDKIVWTASRQAMAKRRKAPPCAALFIALALISCADDGQEGSLQDGAAAPVTGADSDASAAGGTASGGSAAGDAGSAGGETDASAAGAMTGVDAGPSRGQGGRS